LIPQGQEFFPEVLKPQCRVSDARQTIGLFVGPCPYSVIDRPVKPFYDPTWGGWEIPLAGEPRRLAAIVTADMVGYSHAAYEQIYYSSLMPRTYLCARLLETLD
jgi:hypothetical protein